MSDMWFYRMFGQDFGPVAFDELKVLAESGSISNDDEVRPENSSDWVSVAAALGLKPAEVTTTIATVEPAASSTAVAGGGAGKDAPAGNVGADDWYCMFHGQEMGPLPFEDLLDFASQGQLVAEDEVKLGSNGKWRRVGSIGRLASALPFQEAPAPLPPPKPAEPKPAAPAKLSSPSISTVTASPPQPAAPPPPAPVVQIGVQAAELALIKAQTAYEATQQAAMQLVAWASSPSCNPQWWAVINGIESGPVDFKSIFEWAVSGRLQATDFVRNGVFGQYGPVSNLPHFFSAVGIMKQATDAYERAKSEAPKSVTLESATQSAALLSPAPAPIAAVVAAPTVTVAPVPVAPTPAPIPVAPVRAPEIPALEPIPSLSQPEPQRPSANPYAAAGFSSSMGGSSSKPAAYPPKPSKPVPRRSSGQSSGFSMSAITDQLKGPAGKGLMGVGGVVLLAVIWFFLPAGNGADIKRYQDLKQILTEVRAKRAANSTDFGDLQNKAKKLSAEITPILKVQASSEYPAKQNLLWAARDELPRMMKANLSEETPEETNFADRLDNVKKLLNIKD